MARLSRRTLPPINTVKHYVHRSNALIMTGNVLGHLSVNAITKGAARSTTGDVDEGAVIKAIHLEYWLNGTDNQDTSQFTFIAYKLPAGQISPDSTEMLNLQSWNNKKNILFSSQGVLAKDGAQSIPVIRNWVLIPKGKQRFGLGDRFEVAALAVGTLQFCGIATYKEYS